MGRILPSPQNALAIDKVELVELRRGHAPRCRRRWRLRLHGLGWLRWRGEQLLAQLDQGLSVRCQRLEHDAERFSMWFVEREEQLSCVVLSGRRREQQLIEHSICQLLLTGHEIGRRWPGWHVDVFRNQRGVERPNKAAASRYRCTSRARNSCLRLLRPSLKGRGPGHAGSRSSLSKLLRHMPKARA